MLMSVESMPIASMMCRPSFTRCAFAAIAALRQIVVDPDVQLQNDRGPALRRIAAIGQPEESHTRPERELTHRRAPQRTIGDHGDGAGLIDERHRFGFGGVAERHASAGAHIQARDHQRKEDRAVADERHDDGAAPDAETAERLLDRRGAPPRGAANVGDVSGGRRLHRDGQSARSRQTRSNCFADGAD